MGGGRRAQAEFVGTDVAPDLASPHGSPSRANQIRDDHGAHEHSRGQQIGAAFDREFDVNQRPRMVHVRLRHQQGEVLAAKRGEDLR